MIVAFGSLNADMIFEMTKTPLPGQTLLAHVRTILNLAPAIRLDFAALRLCNHLVVNEDEARAAASWLGCEPTARALSATLGTGIIRTMGAEGAEAADDSGYCLVPAHTIEPVDTTAAGDCFIGVLASGLDRKLSLEKAIARATAAAALACREKGSQSSLPWRNDTERFVLEAA